MIFYICYRSHFGSSILIIGVLHIVWLQTQPLRWVMPHLSENVSIVLEQLLNDGAPKNIEKLYNQWNGVQLAYNSRPNDILQQKVLQIEEIHRNLSKQYLEDMVVVTKNKILPRSMVTLQTQIKHIDMICAKLGAAYETELALDIKFLRMCLYARSMVLTSQKFNPASLPYIPPENEESDECFMARVLKYVCKGPELVSQPVAPPQMFVTYIIPFNATGGTGGSVNPN